MGVIINVLVIVVCGLIGMRLKSGISPRFHERIMGGIALCILAIGIDGSLQGNNTMVTILSIVFGSIIGEALDIDKSVIQGVGKLQGLIKKDGLAGDDTFSQGFISAVMIFCIGSMTILGALQLGLRGDNTMLYTKSILDGITAILLGSSLGLGVAFSAVPVLVIEGGIAILAGVLAPVLSDVVVNEIIAVGSLMLVGLSFNMLNLTELKILNYTPAMLLPPLFLLFF